MIVELGIGVATIGAAGYVLWKLRKRKATLRRHVLRRRKAERPSGE